MTNPPFLPHMVTNISIQWSTEPSWSVFTGVCARAVLLWALALSLISSFPSDPGGQTATRLPDILLVGAGSWVSSETNSESAAFE